MLGPRRVQDERRFRAHRRHVASVADVVPGQQQHQVHVDMLVPVDFVLRNSRSKMGDGHLTSGMVAEGATLDAEFRDGSVLVHGSCRLSGVLHYISNPPLGASQ